MINAHELVKVGIESWGIYIPELRHSGEYIAERTGIPQNILKTKFGLNSKSIAGPEDHNVAMAVKASNVAIRRAGINAKDIDLIIWAGEVYDKYLLQTYGIKLQNDIGAANAMGFDINQRCATFMLAFNLVKGLMVMDSRIRRVLIASGYRNCDLINYENPRTRFMTSLSASAVAILLKRDHPENILLASEVITDGQFSEDVYIPGGGSGIPVTTPGGDIPPTAYDVIAKKLNYLEIPDPESMKNRLDKLSMANFIKVIDSAIRNSGYSRKDIGYLGLLHMKPSAFDHVAGEFGVDVKAKTTYWDEFVNLGHMGQNDGIMSLEFGIRHNKIKPGDLVVLAAAGIGYSWGAACIKWGRA
ncbi:MAG: 3-oxoacyl-(acyl-carrier-protein) synthase 3 [Smithella sp. PtaU1.Bin162]|nr:MAG: 3-oxoacyl-(acyl-carrier-protein) synthase 3 [Smithella sp. PtaU1.Bin162]